MKLMSILIGGAAAMAIVGAFVASASGATASSPGPEGPRYTADGKLVFPEDYRTWIYLSTGMDMAYVKGADPKTHLFDSVFVNRQAYEVFQKTGTWPDGTMLVLEVRRGQGRGSINQSGQFQTARAGLEVHVKDEKRFAASKGWAFFNRQGAMAPLSDGCNACHEAHAAVDTTFVQFYPTLLPIAQEKKTLSEAYLKDEAQLAAVK